MLTVDERIGRLETENEALRTHLRLALSTIRDPIPETLYLRPDEEEMEIGEEFGDDVFDRYEGWDDCWAILGEEADGLAGEIARWRSDAERDNLQWRDGIAGTIEVAG